MCGIVGEVLDSAVEDDLIDGLSRLEYRGYDSAGIAVVNGSGIELSRAVGKLDQLKQKLQGDPLTGTCGIAHTRWATHGRPTEYNAHPHRDQSGRVGVVHNGIIENYLKLKKELQGEGVEFTSDTDSEVIAQLIGHHYDGDLKEAVRSALQRLHGSYAIAVVHAAHPDTIVCARHQSPLVVGYGDAGNYVASDVTAFLDKTKQVSYLKDGEMATISQDSVKFFDIGDGERIEKEIETIEWDLELAKKGGYPHFMLKEIHEQPDVFSEALRGRLSPDRGEVHLPDFESVLNEDTDLIYFVACGTSWHACLIAKYVIEELAGVPVQVDIASEFRYRDPVVTDNTALVAVSQSGETADTLAAVRLMEEQDVPRLGIVNVQGSSITQHCTQNYMIQAGPEISVASTKAFISQLAVIYQVALKLAQVRGTVDEEFSRAYVQELRRIPDKLNQVVQDGGEMERWAERFAQFEDFLYLGRSVSFPVALEGALKLKEISYNHAEGYPAGEMKHGPIALIEPSCPTMLIAPDSHVFEKSVSNLEEIKARGGEVMVMTDRPEEFTDYTDWAFEVPSTRHLFSPVLTSVPLQLFAYYCALERGTDVDQPRNLAKSVTVE